MLWVGRLDTNKDPFTALDGFTRIAARLPEAQLTMVFAEDLLGGEVQRRVAASTVLRDRVHLRGRVEWRALPALYATADLFLLASHHEGSGFALIEAIAFGVTPVVSDIPAFRAITSGGRDGGGIGALFPIEDAGALAIALERAGAVGPGPDQRREEVKRFFARRLSWAAIARQALAAYTAAAQQRTARPGAAVNP
jgi:glycosyltransferase involved in cell wall biosynthesis